MILNKLFSKLPRTLFKPEEKKLIGVCTYTYNRKTKHTKHKNTTNMLVVDKERETNYPLYRNLPGRKLPLF